MCGAMAGAGSGTAVRAASRAGVSDPDAITAVRGRLNRGAPPVGRLPALDEMSVEVFLPHVEPSGAWEAIPAGAGDEWLISCGVCASDCADLQRGAAQVPPGGKWSTHKLRVGSESPSFSFFAPGSGCGGADSAAGFLASPVEAAGIPAAVGSPALPASGAESEGDGEHTNRWYNPGGTSCVCTSAMAVISDTASDDLLHDIKVLGGRGHISAKAFLQATQSMPGLDVIKRSTFYLKNAMKQSDDQYSGLRDYLLSLQERRSFVLFMDGTAHAVGLVTGGGGKVFDTELPKAQPAAEYLATRPIGDAFELRVVVAAKKKRKKKGGGKKKGGASK